MFSGGREAGERAEVPPPARFRVFLSRIQPVFAGLELSDHCSAPGGLSEHPRPQYLQNRPHFTQEQRQREGAESSRHSTSSGPLRPRGEAPILKFLVFRSVLIGPAYYN